MNLQVGGVAGLIALETNVLLMQRATMEQGEHPSPNRPDSPSYLPPVQGGCELLPDHMGSPDSRPRVLHLGQDLAQGRSHGPPLGWNAAAI